MTMRVLLRGAYIPTYGGVSVHVKRLKNELMKKGVSVELATYPEVPGGGVNDRAEYRLQWRGVIKKILQGNYTLVHVHTSGVNPRELLRFAAFKLHGTKLVVSFHSYRPELAHNSWKYKLAVCVLLKTIDHIICVSSAVGDRILTCGYPAARISVISSYLPPPLLEEDRLAVPSEVWEFVTSHRPILTANAFRLNWFRGQDLYGLDMCVELCQSLINDYADMGFVFALPTVGDEVYFAEIKGRLRASGLENVFFFYHTPTEFWPIIERSDLFLRPTNSDGGCSLSVAEAIELGVPAIASDVALRPPGTVLFQTRNFADLRAKTQEILSHLDDYRKRLEGVSASPSDPTSQILDVYKQVSNYSL